MMTDAPTEADLDLIQRIIPHRYPFLLIDKVVDIVPNKGCVGITNVTYNEPHFQVHFPAKPIMTAGMGIEAMAQASNSPSLSNSIVFGVLIIVLLVKPAGLLGKYVPEKV